METTEIKLEERPHVPPPPSLDHWILIMVPVGQLFIDRRYQRGLVKGQVRRLVEHWDWDKYHPIFISHRTDGRYAVLAGQQRTTAAIELGIEQLPAILQTNTDIQGEAKSYLGSGEIANIQASDRFKARLIANERKAYEIWAIIEHEGFRLACMREEEGVTHSDPFSIKAVYACETVFDAGYLSQTLKIIQDAWGNQPVQDMVSGNMIRGVYLAYRHLEFNNVDDITEVAKRLSTSSVKDILDKGYDRYRSMVVGRSIDAGVAAVLVEQFNYRRRDQVPEFSRKAAIQARSQKAGMIIASDPKKRAAFIEQGRQARERSLEQGPRGRYQRKTS